MDPGNRRAIYAALFANAGIAVLKFAGWTLTGAASMLAEAVHSMADSSNQALLLWGGAAAQREPSARHPFGYGRERYFWCFVVALVIFSMGGLFALYEGVSKWLHPHALEAPLVAVAILVAGLVLESFSLRTAVREARPHKGDASWWHFVRHTRNPELPVVLLEDLGALLGLGVALIGVSVAWWTGDARFDALGSAAIGVLLIGIAVVLAIEMKSLLIGEAAGRRRIAAIERAILGAPHVRRLIHMRTMHVGPEQLLIGARVEFEPGLASEAQADAIDAIEAAVREALGRVRAFIYIEPARSVDGGTRAPHDAPQAPARADGA